MTATRSSDPRLTVELVTDQADAGTVASVAAVTFPLACPPHSAPADIAGFIRDNLSENTFRQRIDSAESDLFLARVEDGTVIGYALVHHRAPTDADVAAAVTARPCAEVSKMYVLPDHHARGRTQSPAAALMTAALAAARARGAVAAWLGVNQENERAQRFYSKMGFVRTGIKTFDLNGSTEHDYVFVRDLTDTP